MNRCQALTRKGERCTRQSTKSIRGTRVCTQHKQINVYGGGIFEFVFKNWKPVNKNIKYREKVKEQNKRIAAQKAATNLALKTAKRVRSDIPTKSTIVLPTFY